MLHNYAWRFYMYKFGAICCLSVQHVSQFDLLRFKEDGGMYGTCRL